MKQVLVCDDDMMIRTIITKILTKEGYSVLEASDAYVALEIIKKKSIDLLIVDFMMPELDGHQLIECIRDAFDILPFPVVMITSLCDQTLKEKSLKLGVVAHLTKPFNVVTLSDQINQLMHTQIA